MSTDTKVVHKSGDCVYPDGYPNGATADNWPAEFRKIKIPFVGEPQLTAEEMSVITGMGHTVELLDKGPAEIPADVRKYLDVAGLPQNGAGVATFDEFLAMQQSGGRPVTLAAFRDFAAAKHNVAADVTLPVPMPGKLST